MTIITVEEECEHCNGAGSYEQDRGGYSSHSLNQVFFEETCRVCKGERTVPVDICAGCHHEADNCHCPDISLPLPLAGACVALAPIQYCFDCRIPTLGSIGQAGFYWARVCQSCKDRADGIVRAQVLSSSILIHAIDSIANRSTRTRIA